MKKSEQILQELWDTIERNDLHIIGVPEEKREKWQKAH